jgi:DNA-nicking Smr family endonuclease
MKRKPDRAGNRAADLHLWRLVAATVRPFPGRVAPAPITPAAPPAPRRTSSRSAPTEPPATAPPRHAPRAAQAIEPGRLHRLASGRDALDGRLDLHGLTQDRAKAALAAFVLRGHAEGRRAILVITGKGALGDGVLRRRVPEWLGEAPLRPFIAGLTEAHRRHGGAGALYVALKRNPRG